MTQVDTALLASAFGPLFQRIVTVCTQRLERASPEGFLVTVVLLYVVAVQTAFACVYPAAHLAGEVVPYQH